MSGLPDMATDDAVASGSLDLSLGERRLAALVLKRDVREKRFANEAHDFLVGKLGVAGCRALEARTQEKLGTYVRKLQAEDTNEDAGAYNRILRYMDQYAQRNGIPRWPLSSNSLVLICHELINRKPEAWVQADREHVIHCCNILGWRANKLYLVHLHDLREKVQSRFTERLKAHPAKSGLLTFGKDLLERFRNYIARDEIVSVEDGPEVSIAQQADTGPKRALSPQPTALSRPSKRSRSKQPSPDPSTDNVASMSIEVDGMSVREASVNAVLAVPPTPSVIAEDTIITTDAVGVAVALRSPAIETHPRAPLTDFPKNSKPAMLRPKPTLLPPSRSRTASRSQEPIENQPAANIVRMHTPISPPIQTRSIFRDREAPPPTSLAPPGTLEDSRDTPVQSEMRSPPVRSAVLQMKKPPPAVIDISSDEDEAVSALLQRKTSSMSREPSKPTVKESPAPPSKELGLQFSQKQDNVTQASPLEAPDVVTVKRTTYTVTPAHATASRPEAITTSLRVSKVPVAPNTIDALSAGANALASAVADSAPLSHSLATGPAVGQWLAERLARKSQAESVKTKLGHTVITPDAQVALHSSASVSIAAKPANLITPQNPCAPTVPHDVNTIMPAAISSRPHDVPISTPTENAAASTSAPVQKQTLLHPAVRDANKRLSVGNDLLARVIARDDATVAETIPAAETSTATQLQGKKSSPKRKKVKVSSFCKTVDELSDLLDRHILMTAAPQLRTELAVDIQRSRRKARGTMKQLREYEVQSKSRRQWRARTSASVQPPQSGPSSLKAVSQSVVIGVPPQIHNGIPDAALREMLAPTSIPAVIEPSAQGNTHAQLVNLLATAPAAQIGISASSPSTSQHNTAVPSAASQSALERSLGSKHHQVLHDQPVPNLPGVSSSPALSKPPDSKLVSNGHDKGSDSPAVRLDKPYRYRPQSSFDAIPSSISTPPTDTMMQGRPKPAILVPQYGAAAHATHQGPSMNGGLPYALVAGRSGGTSLGAAAAGANQPMSSAQRREQYMTGHSMQHIPTAATHISHSQSVPLPTHAVAPNCVGADNAHLSGIAARDAPPRPHAQAPEAGQTGTLEISSPSLGLVGDRETAQSRTVEPSRWEPIIVNEQYQTRPHRRFDHGSLTKVSASDDNTESSRCNLQADHSAQGLTVTTPCSAPSSPLHVDTSIVTASSSMPLQQNVADAAVASAATAPMRPMLNAGRQAHVMAGLPQHVSTVALAPQQPVTAPLRTPSQSCPATTVDIQMRQHVTSQAPPKELRISIPAATSASHTAHQHPVSSHPAAGRQNVAPRSSVATAPPLPTQVALPTSTTPASAPTEAAAVPETSIGLEFILSRLAWAVGQSLKDDEVREAEKHLTEHNIPSQALNRFRHFVSIFWQREVSRRNSQHVTGQTTVVPHSAQAVPAGQQSIAPQQAHTQVIADAAASGAAPQSQFTSGQAALLHQQFQGQLTQLHGAAQSQIASLKLAHANETSALRLQHAQREQALHKSHFKAMASQRQKLLDDANARLTQQRNSYCRFYEDKFTKYAQESKDHYTKHVEALHRQSLTQTAGVVNPATASAHLASMQAQVAEASGRASGHSAILAARNIAAANADTETQTAAMSATATVVPTSTTAQDAGNEAVTSSGMPGTSLAQFASSIATSQFPLCVERVAYNHIEPAEG